VQKKSPAARISRKNDMKGVFSNTLQVKNFSKMRAPLENGGSEGLSLLHYFFVKCEEKKIEYYPHSVILQIIFVLFLFITIWCLNTKNIILEKMSFSFHHTLQKKQW